MNLSLSVFCLHKHYNVWHRNTIDGSSKSCKTSSILSLLQRMGRFHLRTLLRFAILNGVICFVKRDTCLVIFLFVLPKGSHVFCCFNSYSYQLQIALCRLRDHYKCTSLYVIVAQSFGNYPFAEIGRIFNLKLAV